MSLPTRFPTPAAASGLDDFRREVREFLERERTAGTWQPGEGSWGAHNPELSRRLGERGWIGMTWPREYGGGERSQLERYVLTEELLAAAAPTGAHWVADRQSGPLILRFGTEEQKRRFLPPISRGESWFCIGMSEPDSGSDLASIRTRAVPVEGGWRLRGTKIWTSNAHRAHWIIVLCRTAESGDRHGGMSQLIVDLATEGIEVRPIVDLAGKHSFNEVVFDDVFVPADQLLGEAGAGWRQVTSELAYERGGPERFLTNLHLLVELVRVLGPDAAVGLRRRLGLLVAELIELRSMALSVAGMLEAGETPALEAALVKDLGTDFQRRLPDEVREILADVDPATAERFGAWLDTAVLAAPAYTIQGGTTEILRGIIARGLGLR